MRYKKYLYTTYTSIFQYFWGAIMDFNVDIPSAYHGRGAVTLSRIASEVKMKTDVVFHRRAQNGGLRGTTQTGPIAYVS